MGEMGTKASWGTGVPSSGCFIEVVGRQRRLLGPLSWLFHLFWHARGQQVTHRRRGPSSLRATQRDDKGTNDCTRGRRLGRERKPDRTGNYTTGEMLSCWPGTPKGLTGQPPSPREARSLYLFCLRRLESPYRARSRVRQDGGKKKRKLLYKKGVRRHTSDHGADASAKYRRDQKGPSKRSIKSLQRQGQCQAILSRHTEDASAGDVHLERF